VDLDLRDIEYMFGRDSWLP